MGMYTMLELDVLLKKDTPEPAIELIHIMCRVGGSDKQASITDVLNTLPYFDTSGVDHDLFRTFRGSWQFRCDSAYFDNWAPPYFVRNEDGTYQLRLSFNVKNYEHTIELLLDWLSPFLVPYGDGSIRGKYRYEEDREESLVVVQGGQLVIRARDRWDR